VYAQEQRVRFKGLQGVRVYAILN